MNSGANDCCPSETTLRMPGRYDSLVLVFELFLDLPQFLEPFPGERMSREKPGEDSVPFFVLLADELKVL